MSEQTCGVCDRPIGANQAMIRDKRLGPCHPKCLTGKAGFELSNAEMSAITGCADADEPVDGQEVSARWANRRKR